MASLLELLVSRRMISPEQAREAAALAEETGAFIGRILVSQGSVEEQLLARFLAAECTEKAGSGVPTPDEHLVRLLPERLMRNYRMVPLGRTPSGVLRLAVAEPLSIGGIDQVKRRLGMPVRLILVDPQTIDALLDQTTPPAAPQEAPVAPAGAGASPQRPPSAQAPEAVPDREIPPATPRVAGPAPAAAPAAASPARSETVSPRMRGVRVEAPPDWHPDPVSSPLPPALEAASHALQDEIKAPGKTFIALVGPDGARDLILRRVCGETWQWDQILYLDLIAHLCPTDAPDGPVSATVLDGIDDLSPDEDEERRVLRMVSAAYAAHVPLIVGMRKTPKDSPHLSRGMRLTLGLAKVIALDVEEAPEAARTTDAKALFRALVEETVAWSDAAFPGASLRPLLEATARAYERGNRAEAVAKAATSMASRLAHLGDERGR